MIVQRPTGIFSTILPHRTTDSTSVIYTISANNPPRTSLDFIQAPDGIARRRSTRTHTRDKRRSVIGDLVFTSKKSGLVRASSGTRIFDIGDVIEFPSVADSSEPTVQATPIVEPLPDDNVQVQYNSSVIDLEDLELSPFESQQVNSSAEIAQNAVLASIDDLHTRRRSLEVAIKDSGRKIAELDKAIAGLDAILANIGSGTSSDDITDALNKLVINKNSEQILLDSSITELNEIPKLLKTKTDELRSLAKLIS